MALTLPSVLTCAKTETLGSGAEQHNGDAAGASGAAGSGGSDAPEAGAGGAASGGASGASGTSGTAGTAPAAGTAGTAGSAATGGAAGTGTINGCETGDLGVPGGDPEYCPGEALAWTVEASAARTASTSGDLTQRQNDSAGTDCGSITSGTNAADATYALTPDQDGKLTITVVPADFDAVVYVRTTCDSEASQVVCVDDRVRELEERFAFDVVAGTTYYVFVDGYSSSEGSYTLAARLVPDCAF